MCRKVYKYVNLTHLFFFFFFVDRFPTYGRSSKFFEIGRVVDKACVYTMKGR